jgi:hypothetical protein
MNHRAAQDREKKKTGRNDLCPCGSNKKYKYCCLKKESQTKYKPWDPTGWVVGLYYFFLGFYEQLDDLADTADQNRRSGTGRFIVMGGWPAELLAGSLVLAVIVMIVGLILFGASVFLGK